MIQYTVNKKPYLIIYYGLFVGTRVKPEKTPLVIAAIYHSTDPNLDPYIKFRVGILHCIIRYCFLC